MSMTSSGPQCDVCGKYITGVNGKLMDIWQVPGMNTPFCCHEDCRDGFKDFKIRILETLAGEYESWVRWFLSGQTVSREKVGNSVTTAILETITGRRKGGA